MAWLRRAVAAGSRDEIRLAKGQESEVLRDRAVSRERVAGLEAKLK